MTHKEAVSAIIRMIHLRYPLIPANQGMKKGRLQTGRYWQALSPISRGWQSRAYDIKEDSHANHKEYQIIEQPIQITCYDDQPLNVGGAFDMSHDVRMFINSLPFIEAAERAGIAITRTTELQKLTFTNDNDNYEDEVSFKFSLIYTKSIEPITPVARKVEVDILQV